MSCCGVIRQGEPSELWMTRVQLLGGTRPPCAVLIVALMAGGCEQAPTQSSDPSRPNVLLIVVDTLRMDKLGCYGSTLGATPQMDRLAAESVRFSRACTHAPWTLPAMASLLTGEPVPRHGAGGRIVDGGRLDFRRLSSSVRTVAEVFQDAGYATAEVINVDFLTDVFGMTQGFEDVDFRTFRDNEHSRGAHETTDAAAAWMRGREAKPFFLMVHYFDPHLIYDPPREFRRRFADPQDREDTSWVFGRREQILEYRWGNLKLDEATIRRAEKLYNGEVAYVDSEIGRLLGILKDLRIDDSTVVVLTGDHGEEFFDHGGFEHGHTLYAELIRVPLILRLPDRRKPVVVEPPVGLVDVAPTLCSLAGIAPDPQFTGRNLMELVDGASKRSRPLLLGGNMWGPPLRGWIRDYYKFTESSNWLRLVDVRTPPARRIDLSAAHPRQVETMRDELNLVYRAIDADNRLQPAFSAAERERLQSLGYLR